MSSAWQESFSARCQSHLSHRLIDLFPYSFSRFCVSFEYSRSLWLCALAICKFEDQIHALSTLSGHTHPSIVRVNELLGQCSRNEGNCPSPASYLSNDPPRQNDRWRRQRSRSCPDPARRVRPRLQ